MAQRVKNLPAMWKTWVQSLGWAWQPTPVFLPGRLHSLSGCKESGLSNEVQYSIEKVQRIWASPSPHLSETVPLLQIFVVTRQKLRLTHSPGICTRLTVLVNIQVLFLSFLWTRTKHNFYIHTQFYFCKIDIKH